MRRPWPTGGCSAMVKNPYATEVRVAIMYPFTIKLSSYTGTSLICACFSDSEYKTL
jgi:hypothetical protein